MLLALDNFSEEYGISLFTRFKDTPDSLQHHTDLWIPCGSYSLAPYSKFSKRSQVRAPKRGISALIHCYQILLLIFQFTEAPVAPKGGRPKASSTSSIPTDQMVKNPLWKGNNFPQPLEETAEEEDEETEDTEHSVSISTNSEGAKKKQPGGMKSPSQRMLEDIKPPRQRKGSFRMENECEGEDEFKDKIDAIGRQLNRSASVSAVGGARRWSAIGSAGVDSGDGKDADKILAVVEDLKLQNASLAWKLVQFVNTSLNNAVAVQSESKLDVMAEKPREEDLSKIALQEQVERLRAQVAQLTKERDEALRLLGVKKGSGG